MRSAQQTHKKDFLSLRIPEIEADFLRDRLGSWLFFGGSFFYLYRGLLKQPVLAAYTPETNTDPSKLAKSSP